MARAFVLVLLLALPLGAADKPAVGGIRVQEIPAPATAAATGAFVTVAPDGTAWLTWLDQQGAVTALRCATFDAAAGKWRAPQTIASGPDWFVNWADFPTLTVGPGGQATAVWFVNNPAPAGGAAAHDHHGPGYHARVSRSTDGGKSWSAPAPLTRESKSIEFVSLATLADGRVLAAWLDGRGKQAGGKTQQLYGRILGTDATDTLIDPSVCDCCQTTLTAFLDGSALLAYRGRTAEEIRDIRVSRFRHGAWSEPRPLNHDEWRINGCPVNGPQLASDGGRVAISWFTAADNDPRVLASFSPDAGARFMMPVTINHVKPAGRVATQVLHDGALLVGWVDTNGATWLRRVSPEFTPADVVELAPAQSGRTKGFPRMALLRDYDGGATEAQLLVTFTRDSAPHLRTLLVHIPEGELLEAEKNCDCAPTADQLKGFSIRGTIADRPAGSAALRVQHLEVPGIFEAGTRDFKVEPAVLAAVQAGRQFLGRIEKRDGAWWLFDVRLIASPAR